ncbi:MAG: hypothetical protein ACXAB7_23920 [Candidatus Kariarchaeaceae archaeon]|jgi:hypothetical protein
MFLGRHNNFSSIVGWLSKDERKAYHKLLLTELHSMLFSPKNLLYFLFGYLAALIAWLALKGSENITGVEIQFQILLLGIILSLPFSYRRFNVYRNTWIRYILTNENMDAYTLENMDDDALISYIKRNFKSM